MGTNPSNGSDPGPKNPPGSVTLAPVPGFLFTTIPTPGMGFDAASVISTGMQKASTSAKKTVRLLMGDSSFVNGNATEPVRV
jgi:hypothetical protein